MIVKSKNKGKKIAYTESDTMLAFGDSELTLDLAEYEDDDPVHLTVCYTKKHILTIGAGGITYVAEIDIPPRQYREIPDPEDEESSQIVPVPLDMNAVELTLWALDEMEGNVNEQ